MTRFDRILVPLDGSERAEAVLRWVRLLPAREIRLLRVCEEEGEREAVAAYLAQVANELDAPDRAIDARVAVGVPAERIVAEAREASLVVMCTHGAGGGGRLVYGSVADRVARHAPVPTMLLRGGSEPVATEPVRRIVVPLDGSPTAERALPMAATLAAMVGAPIQLITVDDPADSASVDANLAALAIRLRSAGSEVAFQTRSGEPGLELVASLVPGDVVVATTHGRGTARRWQIGSVAENLLRRAPAPVLLVRADVP